MTLIDPDELQKASENDPNYSAIKLKTPKRVLHFSDGILEEYSDDEIVSPPPQPQPEIDPSTYTWGPWLWYKATSVGSSALYAVDTAGEYLASFFGITTPRYYFELEEYKRKEAEEAELREQEKGWSKPAASQVIPMEEVSVKQPDPITKPDIQNV